MDPFISTSAVNDIEEEWERTDNKLERRLERAVIVRVFSLVPCITLTINFKQLAHQVLRRRVGQNTNTHTGGPQANLSLE